MDAVPDLLDAAKTHSGIDIDCLLAAGIGVTKAAISQWRMGTTVPRDIYAPALARLSGLPEQYVLMCLRMARWKRATVPGKVSWNNPVTRGIFEMIRRFDHHDSATLDRALSAVAQTVELIALQIANAGEEPPSIMRNMWMLGYTRGAVESAVRSCSICQDVAISTFVEIAMQRLLANRQRAAQAMTLMHTFSKRDDFNVGQNRGKQDRTAFVTSGIAPAGLHAHLRSRPVTELKTEL